MYSLKNAKSSRNFEFICSLANAHFKIGVFRFLTRRQFLGCFVPNQHNYDKSELEISKYMHTPGN